MTRAWTTTRTTALAAIVSVGLMMGCSVDAGPESGGSGGEAYAGGSSTSSSGASGSSSSSSGGGSTPPMLVDVDPNRTMNATPGNGVGVFTQYTTGGHWDVWWTCDTNKTDLPCAFDVTVTVTTGSIANVAGPSLQAGDRLSQSTAQAIELATTTTSSIDGFTFDTVVPAGTTPVITLDAKLSGTDIPQYLFFVQDGEINGNYAGMLTDPLMLAPSSP
jgi:hypothetical protein